MWDNHEFSWKGWQSQQNFDGVRPAQRRKVAANQAWYEYQPARVVKPGSPAGDRFVPPAVHDAPITRFDDHGLGLEPGNLAAIGSLKLFRSFRFGKNVELILTDNRSFRSEPLTDRPELDAFDAKGFPWFSAEEVIDVLDGGKDFAGGHPPATLRFGGAEIANPRRAVPAQSMLGAEQKAWFLAKLGDSTARWRLWGNSVSMLDWRTDLQNLPPELGAGWPVPGYGLLGGDDWSGYRHERAEIFDSIRRRGIAGFATLGGDRHAFIAGLLAPALPPHAFAPVGVEFVTGSISAPGLFEAAEHKMPADHPLRALYLHDLPPADPAASPRPARHQAAIDFSVRHGVRASLALARTHDRAQALQASNPAVAPHLAFTDTGGHGYAVVRAGAEALEVEFVCVVRPLERSATPDGGPLAYRVTHRAERWSAGATPKLERTHAEGELPLGA